MVVILFSTSVQALVLPSDINPGSSKFYSKTNIKAAAERTKKNCTDASDYVYKGLLFAGELYLPTLIGGKLLVKNAAGQVLGQGLKKTGMSRTGVSVSKKILMPKLKKLPILNMDTISKKLLSNIIYGMFLKRPTPGGLKLASKIAIEMTAESYYYVSIRNPGDPYLRSAETHLQNAVNEYNSYTGYIDAFTLTYSSYSPEGYNKILSECLAAIDDLNTAKREKKESKIKVF